jgi:hypothetical protein
MKLEGVDTGTEKTINRFVINNAAEASLTLRTGLEAYDQEDVEKVAAALDLPAEELQREIARVIEDAPDGDDAITNMGGFRDISAKKFDRLADRARNDHDALQFMKRAGDDRHPSELGIVVKDAHRVARFSNPRNLRLPNSLRLDRHDQN